MALLEPDDAERRPDRPPRSGSAARTARPAPAPRRRSRSTTATIQITVGDSEQITPGEIAQRVVDRCPPIPIRCNPALAPPGVGATPPAHAGGAAPPTAPRPGVRRGARGEARRRPAASASAGHALSGSSGGASTSTRPRPAGSTTASTGQRPRAPATPWCWSTAPPSSSRYATAPSSPPSTADSHERPGLHQHRQRSHHLGAPPTPTPARRSRTSLEEAGGQKGTRIPR